MAQSSEFALSRIFAEGWTAARGKLTEAGEIAGPDASARNPYAADPQRGRWDDGFKAGQRSARGRIGSAGRFRSF